jgi:hypothetical protein
MIMKIGGIDPVQLSNEDFIVLPRGKQNIVIRAKALPDMDEFYALCPEPTPPGKLTKDGWVPEPNDEGFRAIKATWSLKRVAYMVIKSLEPSAIEWDIVDVSNPKTWNKWDEELRNNGITQIEVSRILHLVFEVNSLDEDKLQKARDFFQLGQEKAKLESSGQPTEPPTTQSGEPASTSE